ncbi:hypothetical protein [Frankia tisae]|nr:hypothetical protein [Frankia tisae]
MTVEAGGDLAQKRRDVRDQAHAVEPRARDDADHGSGDHCCE